MTGWTDSKFDFTVVVEENPVNVDHDVLCVELRDTTSKRKLDMLWIDRQKGKQVGIWRQDLELVTVLPNASTASANTEVRGRGDLIEEVGVQVDRIRKLDRPSLFKFQLATKGVIQFLQAKQR